MPMSRLLAILISVLALSLPGCATAPADPSGGVARLSPEELARLVPKPDPKLPPAELVRMSKQALPAQDIIAKIKETGSRYALSASQVIDLHAQGVSAEVLDYIQSAREQELRERAIEEINQRERLHADELWRAQELWHFNGFYDPWWPSYHGFGWDLRYPLRPYGGIYRRR